VRRPEHVNAARGLLVSIAFSVALWALLAIGIWSAL